MQTSFTVTSENGTSSSDLTGLNNVIRAIDVGGADAATGTTVTPYTITIDGQINLTSDLLAINLPSNATLLITGGAGGQVINGTATAGEGGTGVGERGFFVYSGDVTLENLAIDNTVAQGGNGGSSEGGGGAGLGGGLFVAGTDGQGGNEPGQAATPAVTLVNVSFAADSAIGGDSGPTLNEGVGGGGGGGLGGAGGSYDGNTATNGGGGGIGSGASGGLGDRGNGGSGIIPGAGSGGSGAGSGGASGGGGGGGGVGVSEAAGFFSAGGGGGGVDGGAGVDVPYGQGGGGGHGGYGGGGGGGVAGGAGGFGGGGGGGTDYGGAGGFGGGGGGGSTGGGGGGFGGGNGQISSGGGGGGLGAGGDVFVQTGALLTIEGGTLDGGTASGGDQGQGTAGQGLGGGIFIQGGANGQTQDLSFAPIAGQTLTINDVIADEPGSPSGGTATAGAGGLLLNGAGKVVLDADNTFTGGITVDSGTLELAASGAAGSGTITLGDPLLVFDAAYLPSGGTESANPIAGFGGSDEIDLVGLHYVTGATASLNGTTLTVTSNNVTDTLTLTGLSSGTKFQAISDGNTTPGTMVEEQMPCFCRGTLIMTPAGEVPVEALRVGDRVTTLAGAVRPITWFGRGRSSVTSVDKGACPIIVRRDALSEGVPNADLYLTAGHALFIEGVLVPVGCLVNDRSILRDERPQVVEFYHVELAGQDVLLANGTPAESYRDEGNRIRFQNADRSQNRAEEITPYAPVWDSGERVARVALRLRQRAGIADLTDDPDLHLLLDGGRLDPVRVAGAVHHFRLPRMPADLRIASRRSVPVAVGIGADARSLGVALRRVVLRPADGAVEIGYDAAGLRHGFHRAEPEGGLRWTDGEGVVPEAAYRGLAGPCELELHLAAVSRYPVAAAQQGQTRP